MTVLIFGALALVVIGGALMLTSRSSRPTSGPITHTELLNRLRKLK